jgi:DNA-binding beta-propeller fold protein YncE
MWPIYKAVLAGAAAAALAAGCTASGEEVEPKPGQLFFPTGAVMSPTGKHLFVANANSDLRFDSGAVLVVQLAGGPTSSVEGVIASWLGNKTIPGEQCDFDEDKDGTVDRTESCCLQDSDFTETLVCDESLFLFRQADRDQPAERRRGPGVRIGNFATDIALQDLGNGGLRLVVPTRGDPSIAWVDWDPTAERLTCTDDGNDFALCDDPHRLSFNDADEAAIPSEPFGVFADSAGEFAVVTHLTTGAVTLIDSPRNGLARVTDVSSGNFDPDPITGRPSATSVAGRTPHAPNDIVYVGSRTDDRIQMFTVGRPVNGAAPFLLDGGAFHLDAVGTEGTLTGASTDTRGMMFSPSGDRLYLVNRKPPSLQVVDTAIGPTGFPNNTTVGATDLCRQASGVAVIDPGDGERAYVTCFQDGQVYVINPNGRVRVEDVITVGRGPYAVQASPDGKRLYVTNFLEDSIAVIDLAPGSPTRNRVVLRIGLRADERSL